MTCSGTSFHKMVLSPPCLMADLDSCDILQWHCEATLKDTDYCWQLPKCQNATNMPTSRDIHYVLYVRDLQRFLEVRLIMFWPQIFITNLLVVITVGDYPWCVMTQGFLHPDKASFNNYYISGTVYMVDCSFPLSSISKCQLSTTCKILNELL